MTAPRTWDYLGSFESCLQLIQGAGYRTTAGTKVTREPNQIPDDNGAVIAIAIEKKERASDPALKRTHRLVTVAVLAKVSTTLSDAQECLHDLLDDIEQALDANLQSRLAQFAQGSQFPAFVSAEPVPPPDGAKWVGAVVRYAGHVLKR